ATPSVRQEAAALRDFDPAYVADGSITSFPPSRRVRFAPRADIRLMPAFTSTRPNASKTREADCASHLPRSPDFLAAAEGMLTLAFQRAASRHPDARVLIMRQAAVET